jgi:hypothetical protein
MYKNIVDCVYKKKYVFNVIKKSTALKKIAIALSRAQQSDLLAQLYVYSQDIEKVATALMRFYIVIFYLLIIYSIWDKILVIRILLVIITTLFKV